ncbi:MAG: hypothetical protein KA052_00770 [Candidatus Pacebacteria bacterium]|nr:hypothetical protein [Candidatus Paceibacterota bacterium]
MHKHKKHTAFLWILSVLCAYAVGYLTERNLTSLGMLPPVDGASQTVQ